jgi:hypothetical protein
MTISFGNGDRHMKERIVRKEAMEYISKNSIVSHFAPNYAVCRIGAWKACMPKFGGGRLETYLQR